MENIETIVPHVELEHFSGNSGLSKSVCILFCYYLSEFPNLQEEVVIFNAFLFPRLAAIPTLQQREK